MRKFLAMLGEPSDPALYDADELAAACDGDELLADFIDHSDVGDTQVAGGGAFEETLIAHVADDYRRPT